MIKFSTTRSKTSHFSIVGDRYHVLNCNLGNHACNLRNMIFQASKPTGSLTENDLRLMRIFKVVAEAGGVTAAETKLHMERSTISRHIKALEERLCGVVCLRGPAGFELTTFGESVLRAAIMACDTLDNVRNELNMARNVVTGDLAIGLSDNCLTNGNARIVAAIAQFRQQAPAVNLHIAIRPPNELLEGLAARHFHLCVAGKPALYEKMGFEAIFEEEFTLYVGGLLKDEPDAAMLSTRGYVLVTRQNDRRTKNVAAQLNIVEQATASGLEAVATLLASGGFVGFLPTHYAATVGPIFGLKEVKGAEHLAYRAQFYLAKELNRPMSAQARLFSEAVLSAHR